ncbi:MAG TPA: response regulator [Candidatus Limnocylindrales bacterium]|jgi:two-component system, chemotaxis family, chemotaxis protein CheY|nr:response regulator [Candidatus Limnocylindrales bacterium]
MTGGRILVVEDDEILRETLAEVMHDEGHDVRTAANGRAALDVLDGWKPDLIILDLMMPLMDAYEFRQRQRDEGKAADARVLILSAARDLEIAADRIGADAWIAKPFRLVEVIGAVDRLLHQPAA